MNRYRDTAADDCGQVNTTMLKVRALRVIAEDRELTRSGATMAVLLELMDATSKSSWRAFISQERLAERTSFSISKVKRAIKALADTGWLTVQARQERRQGRPTTINLYFLRISEKVAQWASERDSAHGGAQATLAADKDFDGDQAASQGGVDAPSHGGAQATQSLVPLSRSALHRADSPKASRCSEEEIGLAVHAIWNAFASSMPGSHLKAYRGWIDENPEQTRRRFRQLAAGVVQGSIADEQTAACYLDEWLTDQTGIYHDDITEVSA